MTNKTNELMQIGLRLGGCRQDRNMTQEELAGRLGITPQAVSKWERCISLPDISMLSDLARLLEVSADWLLGLSEQRGAGAGCPDKAAGASAQTGQVQAEMGSCLRGSLEPLELAFGVGLVPAFMGEASQAEGGSFVEQIRHMKVRLAREGIWTPIVRVRDLSYLLRPADRDGENRPGRRHPALPFSEDNRASGMCPAPQPWCRPGGAGGRYPHPDETGKSDDFCRIICYNEVIRRKPPSVFRKEGIHGLSLYHVGRWY